MKQSVFFLILFIFLIISCDNELSKEERVDQIFSPWDTSDTPGAAISIVQEGEIVFKKAYGMANLEYDIPITTSSVFNIASISKQFTIFSILLLEKEGKLSLDDDIRTYLPEVPDFGKTITLRQLASHTSGLREIEEVLTIAGWRDDDLVTIDDILNVLSMQKKLNFDPGEEFLYSNIGYTLLSEVIPRVSWQSLAQYTKENIFIPLGMTNTLFFDDSDEIVKNRTYSYYPYSDQYKKNDQNRETAGPSNLFTTVEDLSLWAMNFSTMKVGDPESFNKMNQLAVLNNGESVDYGLGQVIDRYNGIQEISHGGGTAGYRSYFTRFPDQDLSVAVMSNDASFPPRQVAHKIVDIYLKDEFPPISSESSDNMITVEKKLSDSYVGEYEFNPGFTINITSLNGELVGQLTNQRKFEMKPISITEFVADNIDGVIEFIGNDKGKIETLFMNHNGMKKKALRIEPFDKSSVEIEQYTGKYYSDELLITYNMTVENNILLAKHLRAEYIALKPWNVDIFTEHLSQGWVEFVRNENMDIIGFKFSTDIARELWFQKLE